MTGARRTALFVAIVCTAAALAGGYLLRALQRPAIAQAPGLSAAAIAVSLPPPSAPFFLFRWTRQGPSYGVLAYTDPDRTAPPVPISNLRCQRVHMAGGRGVCLAARGGTAFRARLFDDSFKVFAELPLPGVPSRTQVSPDGKLAATTVFVSGHSYTDAGFSTQTGIVDLTRGAWLIENLESFTVHRRKAIVRSIDFNFWGVTFMHDGRTFVATLGTKAERLLVRGNVDSRQVEVIEENVECPSLSPDNRRVAFKQRAGGAGASVAWEIWVLDLESREAAPACRDAQRGRPTAMAGRHSGLVREAFGGGPCFHRPMERGGRRVRPAFTIPGRRLFGHDGRPGRWRSAIRQLRLNRPRAGSHRVGTLSALWKTFKEGESANFLAKLDSAESRAEDSQAFRALGT